MIPGTSDDDNVCHPVLVVFYDLIAEEDREPFGQVGRCVGWGVVSVEGPRHHHRSNNFGEAVGNSSSWVIVCNQPKPEVLQMP